MSGYNQTVPKSQSTEDFSSSEYDSSSSSDSSADSSSASSSNPSQPASKEKTHNNTQPPQNYFQKSPPVNNTHVESPLFKSSEEDQELLSLFAEADNEQASDSEKRPTHPLSNNAAIDSISEKDKFQEDKSIKRKTQAASSELESSEEEDQELLELFQAEVTEGIIDPEKQPNNSTSNNITTNDLALEKNLSRQGIASLDRNITKPASTNLESFGKHDQEISPLFSGKGHQHDRDADVQPYKISPSIARNSESVNKKECLQPDTAQEERNAQISSSSEYDSSSRSGSSVASSSGSSYTPSQFSSKKLTKNAPYIQPNSSPTTSSVKKHIQKLDSFRKMHDAQAGKKDINPKKTNDAVKTMRDVEVNHPAISVSVVGSLSPLQHTVPTHMPSLDRLISPVDKSSKTNKPKKIPKKIVSSHSGSSSPPDSSGPPSIIHQNSKTILGSEKRGKEYEKQNRSTENVHRVQLYPSLKSSEIPSLNQEVENNVQTLTGSKIAKRSMQPLSWSINPTYMSAPKNLFSLKSEERKVMSRGKGCMTKVMKESHSVKNLNGFQSSIGVETTKSSKKGAYSTVTRNIKGNDSLMQSKKVIQEYSNLTSPNRASSSVESSSGSGSEFLSSSSGNSTEPKKLEQIKMVASPGAKRQEEDSLIPEELERNQRSSPQFTSTSVQNKSVSKGNPSIDMPDNIPSPIDTKLKKNQRSSLFFATSLVRNTPSPKGNTSLNLLNCRSSSIRKHTSEKNDEGVFSPPISEEIPETSSKGTENVPRPLLNEIPSFLSSKKMEKSPEKSNSPMICLPENDSGQTSRQKTVSPEMLNTDKQSDVMSVSSKSNGSEENRDIIVYLPERGNQESHVAVAEHVCVKSLENVNHKVGQKYGTKLFCQETPSGGSGKNIKTIARISKVSVKQSITKEHVQNSSGSEENSDKMICSPDSSKQGFIKETAILPEAPRLAQHKRTVEMLSQDKKSCGEENIDISLPPENTERAINFAADPFKRKKAVASLQGKLDKEFKAAFTCQNEVANATTTGSIFCSPNKHLIESSPSEEFHNNNIESLEPRESQVTFDSGSARNGQKVAIPASRGIREGSLGSRSVQTKVSLPLEISKANRIHREQVSRNREISDSNFDDMSIYPSGKEKNFYPSSRQRYERNSNSSCPEREQQRVLQCRKIIQKQKNARKEYAEFTLPVGNKKSFGKTKRPSKKPCTSLTDGEDENIVIPENVTGNRLSDNAGFKHSAIFSQRDKETSSKVMKESLPPSQQKKASIREEKGERPNMRSSPYTEEEGEVREMRSDAMELSFSDKSCLRDDSIVSESETTPEKFSSTKLSFFEYQALADQYYKFNDREHFREAVRLEVQHGLNYVLLKEEELNKTQAGGNLKNRVKNTSLSLVHYTSFKSDVIGKRIFQLKQLDYWEAAETLCKYESFLHLKIRDLQRKRKNEQGGEAKAVKVLEKLVNEYDKFISQVDEVHGLTKANAESLFHRNREHLRMMGIMSEITTSLLRLERDHMRNNKK